MKKAELKKNYNTGSCAWLGLDVRTYLAWAGAGLGNFSGPVFCIPLPINQSRDMYLVCMYRYTITSG